MDSDLRMEIFAHCMFSDAFFVNGLTEKDIDLHLIYGEDPCTIEDIEEVADAAFKFSIILRQMMFSSIYMADFTDEKASELKSLSACYNYVISVCDRDDYFGHLPVFDRLLLTCAFVSDFCMRIYRINNLDVLSYGHTFWTMYFEKFNKEFYEKGGWKQLKKVADGQRKVMDLYFYFDIKSLHEVKEALENYFDFKKGVHYDEYKSKLKKKTHISKFWIKHRLQRFEIYIRIPLTYTISALEGENILNNLLRIFDPSLNQMFFSTEMDSLETSTDNVENTNQLSKKGQFISESYSRKAERKFEASDGFPKFSTDNRDKIFGYRKAPPYKDPDTMEINSKYEEITNDKEMKTSYSNKGETNETLKNQMTESELDSNLIAHVLPSKKLIDGFIDNLYSNNTKTHNETAEFIPEKDAVNYKMEELINNDMKEQPTNKEAQMTTTSSNQVTESDLDFSLLSHIFPTKQLIDECIENLILDDPENQSKSTNFSSENENVSDNGVEFSNDSVEENSLTYDSDMEESNSVKNEDAQMAVASTNQITESDLNFNLLPHIFPTKQLIDECIENLILDDPEYQSKSTNFSSENENVSDNDEEFNSENVAENFHTYDNDIEESYRVKNEEAQMAVASTNQITESDLNFNLMPHIFPTKQLIDECIENLTSDYLENQSKSTNFSSENENNNDEEFSNENVGESHHLRNEDVHMQITSMPTPMPKSDFNNDGLVHILPTKQFNDECINNLLLVSPEAQSEKTIFGSQNENVNDYNKGISFQNFDASYTKTTESKLDSAFTNQINKHEDDNLLSHVLPTKQVIDERIDNLLLGNTENPRKISMLPKSLLVNETAEIMKYRKPPSYNVIDTHSKVKDVTINSDELKCENSVKMIDFFEKNDFPTKFTGRTQIPSPNKTTSLDLEKSLDKPSDQRENIGIQKQTVGKAQEDFRNEQKDREIEILLRMVLILNDREITKRVLRTLQKEKVQSKPMQDLPKKKSKKKK